MFISSSSQPKILITYTQFFRVSLFLLSALQLCVIFYLSPLYPTYNLAGNFFFIKFNRFCVFVTFLLYIIWFLSTSFIDRLKFCVWSHFLVFFLEANIASNIFVFFNFLLHDYLLLTSIFYYGFNLLWLLFGALFHVIYMWVYICIYRWKVWIWKIVPKLSVKKNWVINCKLI